MISDFLSKLIELRSHQLISTVMDTAQVVTTGAHTQQAISPSISPLLEREGLLWLYGLVLLIAAGFALKYWFRNFGTGFKGPRASKLKILEVRVIGPKQSLVVAQYEEQKMLLGVSPGIIQLIARLDSDEVITTQSNFSDYLAADLLSTEDSGRLKKRSKRPGPN